jgi:hypothetical protein
VGRQFLDAGEVFHMDGVDVESGAACGLWNARVHVFGGVPVYLYESWPQGNWMAGMGVELEPWCGATVRADYVHIRDENDYYGEVENDLVSVELRQRIGRDASAWARYQHLDDHPRYVDLTYDAYLPRPDVTVRAHFRSLLWQQTAQVYGLDPYFAILQDLEPYYEGYASVAKAFGERFDVEAGATGRWLYDPASESRYNHEFQRYFLTLSTTDWPFCNVSLVATGELWQGDEDIATGAFEIQYDPSPRWRFRLGTDFQLYRTDFFADEERIDSRAVYAEARFEPNRTWRFDARLRWEDDDYATYLVFTVGASYRF